MLRKISVILWLISSLCFSAYAQQDAQTIYQAGSDTKLIGKYLYLLEDKEGKLSFEDARNSANYIKNEDNVPNLGTTTSVFWVRFDVGNTEGIPKLLLQVAQPLLDEITFYYPDSTGQYQKINAGEVYPFSDRKYKEVSYIFDAPIKPGSVERLFLRIKSGEQILLPVYVGPEQKIHESEAGKNTLFGIYAGIILVMFFYNLFVMFSTRDKAYFYYVLHTLFVGITQASLQGFAFMYLWPESPWMARHSIFIFTCLVSIIGIEFLKVFLHTSQNAPRLHKIFYIFTGAYVAYIIMALMGIHALTYRIILGTQSLVAIFILSTAIYVYRKGYQPAKFYLLAWSVFMLSIFLYVIKDFGVLPHNLFTNSLLLIGSALEVALLSFALADKINILTKENVESQQKVVEALLENERIIREQNEMLEQKVTERTAELNKALNDLKSAQTGLVNAEKMSSLGQLTAGIAHEINNPVNYITSNIKPLQRDVDDVLTLVTKYEQINPDGSNLEAALKDVNSFKKEIDYSFLKEEIDLIIRTIDDGAQRTSEIVKGLRNFSRVDEQDIKKADIHTGLDSTLMLLRSKMANIKVVKEYGDIPNIECYLGKLNQVFMNILGNGIQAITSRIGMTGTGGEIRVKTEDAGDSIRIRIKDNGTGMDEKTKAKIFDPFFTTKDVGQGTGLGLSIVYNIIENHHGTIEVESTKGEGAEFIITLPKIQP